MSSNWSDSPENLNSGQNRRFFFVPCDHEIRRMPLKNNRAPLLCYLKLCASFHSHQWNQTGVTVRKQFGSKLAIYPAVWPWNLTDTLKNNRAPLLCHIKLCASFHHHMWNQTGVTVRKRLKWVLTSVTLTFDLWPWPFAWTLPLLMVIISENFMMIRWPEHCQKRVTDGQTGGQTDVLNHS